MSGGRGMLMLSLRESGHARCSGGTPGARFARAGL